MCKESCSYSGDIKVKKRFTEVSPEGWSFKKLVSAASLEG